MSGSADARRLAEALRAALAGRLPGPSLHGPMRPGPAEGREPPGAGRPSAVLVPVLAAEGGASLVLIERSPGGPHGGQVAFPGGREEAADAGPVGAALREAREEIGLEPGSVEVVGLLSPVSVAVSGFLVRPVVGVVAGRPGFVPNPGEVASIIDVPLSAVLDPASKALREVVARGERRLVPCYLFGPTLVWGATAMILSEFEEILRGMA